MTGAFARWLGHRHLPVHLALLAVLLCLPALGVGWQLDDNFHRFVLLDGGENGAGPLEIFSVMRSRPQLTREYMDVGIFPWWTAEDFKIAFLRHASAATAWLDFRLWPGSGPAQHAHSLLWLGAVVFAAAVLYRRLGDRGVAAGLAALLFAVDDAHGTAAGWLANRNALVASFFGLLCLILHERWRRGGRRRAAILAPLALALALAGGELALGAAGYLAAYALFLETGPPRRRLASLAPYAAVLAAWALVYRALGFGAAGSGLYLDPLQRPAAYAAAVVERLPFFLAGQLTPLAADLGALLPAERQQAAWWAAAALVAALAAAFAPAIRASARARFWACGALLSTLPLCATFPTNRVLFLPGVGAMALVAGWLTADRAGLAGARRIAARATTLLLLLTHLVLAPMLLPVTAGIMKTFGAPIERSVLTLPSDPGLERQDLVVVTAPDYLTYVSQIPALLHLEGRPIPRRVRGLAIGPSPVVVARPDRNTLELTMEDGFLGGPLGDLYRPADRPLPPGRRLAVAGMTATIVAGGAGGKPRTVRFTFDRPLESPALRWVFFTDGRFVEVAPPAVGSLRRIPAARGPFDALLAGPRSR